MKFAHFAHKCMFCIWEAILPIVDMSLRDGLGILTKQVLTSDQSMKD